MTTEPQTHIEAATSDYISIALAAINKIPDGVRLANFPSHSHDEQCWCRPKISFGGPEFTVSHKDLNNGEFDS